jgi:hypothetical protein
VGVPFNGMLDSTNFDAAMATSEAFLPVIIMWVSETGQMRAAVTTPGKMDPSSEGTTIWRTTTSSFCVGTPGSAPNAPCASNPAGDFLYIPGASVSLMDGNTGKRSGTHNCHENVAYGRA